ncbi:MAG: hypothetical protein AMXMBFR33_41080 [Candidatus Xenobia bacterium]|jgi:hypothetical protein
MSLPIPNWAQGPIESFRTSQTLPGAIRQEIPTGQVSDVDRSIRTNVDEVISGDETDMDSFKNQPGKFGMGDFLTAEWTGDTSKGTFVEVVKGDRGNQAFVYAEFTPTSSSMVMLSKERGKVTGTARFADTAQPERSFELVSDEDYKLAR